MIITPKEMNDQLDDFTVIDIRPENQRMEFPLIGLDPIISSNGLLLDMDGKRVLVCQFGIVTEGMIIENDLENTFRILPRRRGFESMVQADCIAGNWHRRTKEIIECKYCHHRDGWARVSHCTIFTDIWGGASTSHRWRYGITF